MGKVIFKANENNDTIKSTVDQILQRKGGGDSVTDTFGYIYIIITQQCQVLSRF